MTRLPDAASPLDFWILDFRILDLRVKIEERFQAGAQLLFDIFLAALENMHATWASRPFVSFTGACPTSATSSEGNSLMP